MSTQGPLALDGGVPLRPDPLPLRYEIGDDELELITQFVRSISSTSTEDIEGSRPAQLTKNFRAAGLGPGVRTDFTALLESEFVAFLGSGRAFATSSGTAAIHTAIGAANPEPGDEIITTPLTDLGSMVPILLQNCVPVFADVLPDTCLIDPADIARKITDRTKGIVVVHLFGHPCDMDPIMDIARAHDLFVIEDCVHALGAEYRGRKVGTIGDFGCFGFNGKHLFAHGGGIVVVNRPEYVERADLFRDLARPRERPVKDRRAPFLGARYVMSLLVAPFVLAQVRKAESLTSRTHSVGIDLVEALSGIPGIHPPTIQPDVKHGFLMLMIRVDQNVLGVDATHFAKAVKAEGIHNLIGPDENDYHVLNEHEVLKDKQTYGASGFPFGTAGRDIDYGALPIPVARAAFRDRILMDVYPTFESRDVQDIGAIFRKVAEHYAERKAS